MASSTTIPIAIERADIDTMLSVLPVAKRYTIDASSATGMESTIMKVALQRPRNRNTTSITTRKVMMMVSRSVLMVLMILVEPSTTVSILISDGRFFSILTSCFFTLRMTSTVFAPLCFWMMMRAARRPLV